MKTIYLLIIVVLLVSCKKEKEDEQKTVKIKITNDLINIGDSVTFKHGFMNILVKQNRSNQVFEYVYRTSLEGQKCIIPITPITDTVYIEYEFKNDNLNKIGQVYLYFLDENDNTTSSKIILNSQKGTIKCFVDKNTLISIY
jgi:hypothetical protein